MVRGPCAQWLFVWEDFLLVRHVVGNGPALQRLVQPIRHCGSNTVVAPKQQTLNLPPQCGTTSVCALALFIGLSSDLSLAFRTNIRFPSQCTMPHSLTLQPPTCTAAGMSGDLSFASQMAATASLTYLLAFTDFTSSRRASLWSSLTWRSRRMRAVLRLMLESRPLVSETSGGSVQCSAVHEASREKRRQTTETNSNSDSLSERRYAAQQCR